MLQFIFQKEYSKIDLSESLDTFRKQLYNFAKLLIFMLLKI